MQPTKVTIKANLAKSNAALYNRHVDLHDEVSYPFSNTVAEYVSFVVKSVSGLILQHTV